MKVFSYAEKAGQNNRYSLPETFSGSKSSMKKEEVGRFAIMANYYISELLNNGRKEFNEIVKINELISFEYEMYVEKSRFGLEKYIRESRVLKKSQINRKTMIEELKRSDLKFQLQLKRPNLNSPKSEVVSEISQNEIFTGTESKFISPSRKIVKNKLLVRN